MSPRAERAKYRYAELLLDAYRRAPETPAQVVDRDLHDALALYDRGIPLSWALAALHLAILRRAARPPQAPPLPPIGSLRYFLPVLDELSHQLRAPNMLGYIDYLAWTYSRYRHDTWPQPSKPKP